MQGDHCTLCFQNVKCNVCSGRSISPYCDSLNDATRGCTVDREFISFCNLGERSSIPSAFQVRCSHKLSLITRECSFLSFFRSVCVFSVAVILCYACVPAFTLGIILSIILVIIKLYA